jgi:hypothetical protein
MTLPMAYRIRHKTSRLAPFHADTGDTAPPPSSWAPDQVTVDRPDSIVAPLTTAHKESIAWDMGPSTQNTDVGSAIPVSVWSPKSSSTNASRTSRAVMLLVVVTKDDDR